MENMIKVRAMRAAGIACFLVLAIIGAWIFTTPSGDIVSALSAAGKMVGGGALTGPLCSQPVHLLQDLLPIISGNG